MAEYKTYAILGGTTLLLAGLVGYFYKPKSSKKSKKSKSAKPSAEKKEKKEKKVSNPDRERFLRVATETHAPCLRIINQINRLTSNSSLPITSAELCQELLVKWKELKTKHVEVLRKVEMTQPEYNKLYKKYAQDPEIASQLEPTEFFKVLLEQYSFIPLEGLEEDWVWTLDLKIQQPEQASSLNPIKARNILLDIIRFMSDKFDSVVEEVKKENGIQGKECKFTPAQQEAIRLRWAESIEKGKQELLSQHHVDEKSFEYAIQGYRKLIPDMFNVTKKAQNQLGLEMKQVLG